MWNQCDVVLTILLTNVSGQTNHDEQNFKTTFWAFPLVDLSCIDADAETLVAQEGRTTSMSIRTPHDSLRIELTESKDLKRAQPCN